MKVLAVLSQKGGVGKTTLATCLAVAAAEDGKAVVVFDLDPQATASFWQDVRINAEPAVVSVAPIRVPAMIAASRSRGADLIIIDGAAVARDVTHEGARCADFVLIPTRAAVFDTVSMGHTIEVVRQLRKPFAVVLTFVPPAGQETGDALAMIAALGADACPTTIGQRKAFARAQSSGLAVQEYEPGGTAAIEILQLYSYCYTRLCEGHADG